jgi:hypothetical protein
MAEQFVRFCYNLTCNIIMTALNIHNKEIADNKYYSNVSGNSFFGSDQYIKFRA